MYILAGVIQGLLEWLPVSSSGQVMLALSVSLGLPPYITYQIALGLHGGTLLSAIIYYWKEVLDGLKNLTTPLRSEVSQIWLVATPISVIVGYPVYLMYEDFAGEIGLDWLMLLIGIPLLIIGILGLKTEDKDRERLTMKDLLWLGITQGLAVIPGVSRSGLTIATLLARGISPVKAVRTSFLASIPAILLVSLYIGLLQETYFDANMIIALASSFLSGLVGIAAMEYIAKRVNTNLFSIIIGIILIIVGVLALLI